MRSLDETFKDLQQRLQHGRELGGTGTDPIYYLVFPVDKILEVKQKTTAWKNQLILQTWNVVECSMHKLVRDIFANNAHRDQWFLGESLSLKASLMRKQGIQTRDITTTLTSALTESPELLTRIHSALDEAAALPHGLLLITDLEALHPFLRINSVEAHLHGRVKCPVVVLYPGKREGRTSLRFLEFYPPDPNYRSEHLG